MILIDSDILIWILRNSQEHKTKFIEALNSTEGQLFITPIQYMEIIAGVRKKESTATELFLDSIEMIHIDKDIGKLAGEYLNKYSKSHNVHNADALIASTAKKYGLHIWTNNKKHFPMMKKSEFF